MTRNPQFCGRAKHVDIKYHYAREQVATTLDQVYCRTHDMVYVHIPKDSASLNLKHLVKKLELFLKLSVSEDEC